MAVLGLRFCVRAFPSCGKRGPLFIAVCGPLTIAASPVVEHRLQTRRLSNCGSWAQLLRGMWDLHRPRARTRVPCIGRQILNHCATREALCSTFISMSWIDKDDIHADQTNCTRTGWRNAWPGDNIWKKGQIWGANISSSQCDMAAHGHRVFKRGITALSYSIMFGSQRECSFL